MLKLFLRGHCRPSHSCYQCLNVPFQFSMAQRTKSRECERNKDLFILAIYFPSPHLHMGSIWQMKEAWRQTLFLKTHQISLWPQTCHLLSHLHNEILKLVWGLKASRVYPKNHIRETILYPWPLISHSLSGCVQWPFHYFTVAHTSSLPIPGSGNLWWSMQVCAGWRLGIPRTCHCQRLSIYWLSQYLHSVSS